MYGTHSPTPSQSYTRIYIRADQIAFPPRSARLTIHRKHAIAVGLETYLADVDGNREQIDSILRKEVEQATQLNAPIPCSFGFNMLRHCWELVFAHPNLPLVKGDIPLWSSLQESPAGFSEPEAVDGGMDYSSASR